MTHSADLDTVPFQFTPLREGRLQDIVDVSQEGTFQFTPLREGRPEDGRIDNPINRISIHAPPRGATRRFLPLSRRTSNFNSRPSARGDS